MSDAIKATTSTLFPPARVPTMYFIGVTTGKSSIMKVFPRWAEHLALGDVRMQGIDCNWHDHPDVYRRVVEFIKSDPLSLGALVTTHKIDLLKACRDLFDGLDPYAELLGEISSISKVGDRLVGHAKDPISSGLALRAFIPEGYFAQTNAEVCILGAGGSSIALSCFLMDTCRGNDLPSRLIITNRSRGRLDEIQRLHTSWHRLSGVEYHLTPRAEDNDALVSQLKPQSLVINATGLGKDAPGSPITDAAVFPENGYAWDFNYRGELLFLDQANAQKQSRQLHVEDGWIYFLHGWTQVIAEVFHISIPTSGDGFDTLSQIAKGAR